MKANEKELKLKYAQALIATKHDPLKAAQLVYPHDFTKAAEIASRWFSDEEVKEMIITLRNRSMKEADVDIEDKRQFCENALKSIIDNPAVEARDKILAIDKFMSMFGFHTKAAGDTNTVNIVMSRAIEVPVYESNIHWEKEAEEQQRQLLNVAKSKH